MVYLNETLRVVLPFALHRLCACLHSFPGTFHLAVADGAQVVAVLDGIGDYELLLQLHFPALPVYDGFHFLLDPAALVIDPVKAFRFIQFVYIIGGSAIAAGKPPSFRRKRPFLQVCFQLFYRLCGDEVAGCVSFAIAVEVPVRIGGKARIGADDEP